MTRSHAKSNTSGAHYTYHERRQTEYGSRTQRIGADSMKKLDSCCLCLGQAQNSVACSKGHLYCKECILSSLISQKAQIKSHQESLTQFAISEEQDRQRAKEEARARVLKDFEKGLGLGKAGSGAANGARKNETLESQAEQDASDSARGTKRKFEFDQGAVERLAKEAEDSALSTIEKEQAEARRSKLPSFWLPTLAPEAKIGPLKDVKLQTLCNVGASHPLAYISLKGLMPVIFTYPGGVKPDATPSSDKKPICPSCSRELTNATRCVLLTSRSAAGAEPARKKKKKDGDESKTKADFCCGHVVCGTCADTVVKPGKQCVVCEATIQPEKDMIDLDKEGTGFAAAGGAEARKAGVAFV